MKKIALLVIIAGAITAAAIIYINHQKAPAPAPVATTTPQQTEQPPPETSPAPKPAPQPAVASTPAPAPVAAVTPADTNSTADAPTNTISKVVDALLAAKGGKHDMFLQLTKNGQIDAVIDELKQRAAANPTDPEIPTTLGEALLNKIRAMHDAGVTDPTDLGIYALQADQQFNAALKIDPNNWEANFVQVQSKYYWPPDAQRDAQTVQQTEKLIDQQDTMPSQPIFAQTYATLVKQYQKMGEMDEAAATLKLGLQKYPSDPVLQQMATAK